MITQQVQDRLSEQLNRELSASYLYLAMGSYCRTISLDGFAQWFEEQAEEVPDLKTSKDVLSGAAIGTTSP